MIKSDNDAEVEAKIQYKANLEVICRDDLIAKNDYTDLETISQIYLFVSPLINGRQVFF